MTVDEALNHFDEAGIPNRDDRDVIAGQILAAEIRRLRESLDMTPSQLVDTADISECPWEDCGAALCAADLGNDGFCRYCGGNTKTPPEQRRAAMELERARGADRLD